MRWCPEKDGRATANTHPPRQGGSPRIEAVIRARDQFMAVAAGALVGRCGRTSPVTAAWSRGTVASLWEFGRSWVLCPSTPIGMTLIQRPGRVHVSLGVSPTLGVVYCECIDSVPATSVTRALCYVAGAIGDNRLVMVCENTLCVVVGGAHGVLRTLAPFRGGVLECSRSWIVRKDPRSLDLWKVSEGEPQDGPPHTVSGKFPQESLHLSGDTLVMWGGNLKRAKLRTSSASAVFVDLQKTYTSSEVSIADKWLFPGLASFEVVGGLPICTLPPCSIGDDDLVVTVHHSSSHTSTVTFKNSSNISLVNDNHVWVVTRGPPIKHCFYNLTDTTTPIWSCDEIAPMYKLNRRGVIPVQISPLKIVFVDTNTGSHIAVLSL